jgi:hypothetical protein
MVKERKPAGTMASALEPLAQRMRGQAPLIRSVSRAVFEVKGDRAFEDTIRLVMAWMKRRSPGIPNKAFDGQPFDVGGGGEHPAEAVRFDDDGGRLWSAILDDTDKNVPRRTWVTEVTVGERNGRTAFGARLFNVTKGNDAPFDPSRPGMVHGILTELEAEADGKPLLPNAESIKNSEDFEEFWDLLVDSQRTLPLIVTTPVPGLVPAFDMKTLVSKVSGLTHLVSLTQEMSRELSKRVGRKLSVYEGATRIYAPGFDPSEASPFDHGLWLQRPTDEDEDRLRRLTQIVTWVLNNSVRSNRIPHFPRYSEIRRLSEVRRSQAIRTQGSSAAEMAPLYEAENTRLMETLQAQKAEYDELLADADRERNAAEAQEKEAREDSRLLRLRVEVLEEALRASGRQSSDEPLLRYEDFEAWADKHLVGPIWIAPKAIRAMVRHARFRDVELFGRVLLMLRDIYVPMRRNPGGEQRVLYEQALKELSLEDSGCFGNPNDIRQFPEYKVTYGRDEFWCDNHIKCGGGYDPVSMFRIYYHWHKDERIMLIGHMPTHLDNLRTN